VAWGQEFVTGKWLLAIGKAGLSKAAGVGQNFILSLFCYLV
jgi:hypothetical protein